MTNKETILSELKDLGSTLSNYSPQNTYTVPDGYFEGLSTRILGRIKALEAKSSKEETGHLSPLLGNISNVTPYSVPAGFFQNFSEVILSKLAGQTDHMTSKEEIEALSPVLGSLKNKNPYSVPEGYFETLENGIAGRQPKVISITQRRWYRLAVAAVIIGIIAVGGSLFIGQRQPDINKNPQAWIDKNVNKNVSTDKIDAFVKLAEDEAMVAVEENTFSEQAEIKELMKDVPDKEIEEFLNDAVAFEANDDASAPMNE